MYTVIRGMLNCSRERLKDMRKFYGAGYSCMHVIFNGWPVAILIRARTLLTVFEVYPIPLQLYH